MKPVSQREAAEALAVSERTLARLRSDGTLPPGECWRRKVPQNSNSHVLYDLPACIDVLTGLARAELMEKDQLEAIRKKEVCNDIFL